MTEALLFRNGVLQSVRFAAQQFLSTSNWEEVIEEVLKNLGKAIDVSRVYVFENKRDPSGCLYTTQRFEWVGPGIKPQFDNPELKKMIWNGSGFEYWVDILKDGRPIFSDVDEMPDQARTFLGKLRIQSIIVVPIMVSGRWWGFIGVDECKQKRNWSDAEKDSIQAAADTFGSAIERQLTENALLEAKNSAEEANRAKSQFLGNMSHEIRTPITGVMGMLHLLSRSKLTERQRSHTNNAIRSAEILLSVIGDVLDFSKIEAGRLEFEESEFNVTDIADSVIRSFASRTESKGIELAIS